MHQLHTRSFLAYPNGTSQSIGYPSTSRLATCVEILKSICCRTETVMAENDHFWIFWGFLMMWSNIGHSHIKNCNMARCSTVDWRWCQISEQSERKWPRKASLKFVCHENVYSIIDSLDTFDVTHRYSYILRFHFFPIITHV